MCGSLPVTKPLEEEGGGEKRQILCFAPTETGVKARNKAGDQWIGKRVEKGLAWDSEGLVPGLVSATPKV